MNVFSILFHFIILLFIILINDLLFGQLIHRNLYIYLLLIIIKSRKIGPLNL